MGFLNSSNSKLENVLILIGIVFGVVFIIVITVLITSKVMTSRFRKEKQQHLEELGEENTHLMNKLASVGAPPRPVVTSAPVSRPIPPIPAHPATQV